MRTPAGFTLLELLLSLTLTAVAVTVAGGALRVATSTAERIDTHRDTLESETRLRAMLTDMLRHAPEAELIAEPLFSLLQTDGHGTQLVFLSNGVVPPFGTSRTWRVTLQANDVNGAIELHAIALGAGSVLPPLRATFPGARQMHVQVLGALATNVGSATVRDASAGGGWRRDWPLEASRPAMVAIDFGGVSALPPLVVALDPLATAAGGGAR